MGAPTDCTELWRYVVRIDPNARQLVWIEVCVVNINSNFVVRRDPNTHQLVRIECCEKQVNSNFACHVDVTSSGAHTEHLSLLMIVQLYSCTKRLSTVVALP